MLRRLARPDLRRPPPLAVDRWGLLPALSTGFDKLPVGERRRTCSVWGNEWVFGNVVKCAELLIQLLGTSDGGPWCRRWTASRCGWCFTRWRTAARLPPRRPARRRAWPAPAAGGSPGPPGRRPGGPDPRPAAHTPRAGRGRTRPHHGTWVAAKANRGSPLAVGSNDVGDRADDQDHPKQRHR